MEEAGEDRRRSSSSGGTAGGGGDEDEEEDQALTIQMVSSSSSRPCMVPELGSWGLASFSSVWDSFPRTAAVHEHRDLQYQPFCCYYCLHGSCGRS